MTRVVARDVGIKMPIYHGGDRSIKGRLLKSRIGGLIGADDDQRLCVEALRGVSFSFTEGDRIGLIGRNGAGKSTLLRAIAGIIQPTSGLLTVEGEVRSMLSTANLVNGDLTGYENIEYAGAVLGLTRAEKQELKADVEEFTELGTFLNLPVRTYSAGMQVRLAFAVSTFKKADILVLDEVVGAGDAAFFHKAFDRIMGVATEAKILFVASHSNEALKTLCNKILWLEQGKVIAEGSVDETITAYLQAIAS